MRESWKSWIGTAYKWLMPLALAAAIGVAAVTVVSARSGEDECGEGTRAERLSARWSELAELVGADAEGLKTGLRDGQTLAQIAEANGVEVQTVVDALVSKVNERIDGWVAAGKLTAEEAEAKKAEAAARVEDRVNNGFDREHSRGWGKFRWRANGLRGGVEHG